MPMLGWAGQQLHKQTPNVNPGDTILSTGVVKESTVVILAPVISDIMLNSGVA